MSEEKKQLTYADAGVDIDAGNKAVELMKDSVRATYRSEVIGDLGGFGGLFALNTGKYKEPVLVSGTDGVGTKLKLAFMADKHDTMLMIYWYRVQSPCSSWIILLWTRLTPKRWPTSLRVWLMPARKAAAL